MSDRDVLIIIIDSDKDQTIKDLILKEKEYIMTAMNFQDYTKDLEIKQKADVYFDDLFFSDGLYYVKYIKPNFDRIQIFNLKKDESILVIFSKNSAGCWEHLQVLPITASNSNIKYSTKNETLYSPS